MHAGAPPLSPRRGVCLSTSVIYQLFTLIVNPVDVPWLPAASVAMAVNEWEPFGTVVVFQEVEYGEEVSTDPTLTPSTLNCTPATPTLSEADALKVTIPLAPEPFELKVIATTGAIVSGGVF